MAAGSLAWYGNFQMTWILGIRRLPTAAAMFFLITTAAAVGCSLDLEYLRTGRRVPLDASGGGAGAGGSEGEGGGGGQDAGIAGGGGAEVDADASEPDRSDVVDARGRPLRVSFGSTHILTPLAPSDGGSVFTDSCQPDGVVTAANGTNEPSTGTTAPRSLQVVCSTISIAGTGPYEVTTSTKAILPVRGDFPGTVIQNRPCPNNTVIVGVDTRAGMWVDQLKFLCAELAVSGGPDMYTLSVGSATPLQDIGGLGGSPAPSINCAPGEIVTTFYIHAGAAIDSFGLGCAKPSLDYEP